MLCLCNRDQLVQPARPELMDSAMDAARCFLDLPAELIALVLERCPLDALCAVRCTATPLRALVRPTLCSSAWRRHALNAADLRLQQLAAAAYGGEALKGISGGVRCLHLQNDLLAVGSRDNLARLYGLRTSTCFAELMHPHWVGATAISPDATSLATGCDDCCVRIWPLELTRQAQAPIVMRTRPDATAGGAIVGLDWLSSARLLSCTQSGALALWDANAGGGAIFGAVGWPQTSAGHARRSCGSLGAGRLACSAPCEPRRCRLVCIT